MRVNIKVFYKLIPSFLLAITSHAQSTQNNKFVIYLQNRKKEVKDEVNFFHADKHQTFLQVNTIDLVGMVSHAQRTQNNKFAKSLQYSEERSE